MQAADVPTPTAVPRACETAPDSLTCRPDGAAATHTAFHHPVRVYWEDTDAGGVVFYANYLKFFERARTEWLRARGVSQQALKEQTGALFVVTDTQLSCKRPARLDDLLDVSVQLTAAGRASFAIEQQAWCSGTLLAEGRIRIGCVDTATLRPRRLPETVLQAIGLIR